jgi:hypothetical protein
MLTRLRPEFTESLPDRLAHGDPMILAMLFDPRPPRIGIPRRGFGSGISRRRRRQIGVTVIINASLDASFANNPGPRAIVVIIGDTGLVDDARPRRVQWDGLTLGGRNVPRECAP